ncbi:MAG: class I SAM-dependent methyltransferase [Proteobacteria bacterium]|jgi:ubiquinone/menaquinone biosynthesis C-methylase UbiE|nr:class I SAM-dependent methyltransferase [Alphaproteobacteria bacterium]NCC03178.1 class I SAM-dependent methyltransferase [Pseudomonadota bacterium]
MPTIEWNKGWASNLTDFMNNKLTGKFYGDHWGDPEVRDDLKKVVTEHLRPFVSSTTTSLEIGSGGGRWTQYLLPSKQVYCVDLNAEMFDVLKERFPEAQNLAFVHTKGTDLPGIEPDSIDFVFSFGTFVHCDVPIIESYLLSLYPVIKQTGRAVIQFADKRKRAAAENVGFAETTPDIFSEIAKKCGYNVLQMDDETVPHSAIAHIAPIK